MKEALDLAEIRFPEAPSTRSTELTVRGAEAGATANSCDHCFQRDSA